MYDVYALNEGRSNNVTTADYLSTLKVNPATNLVVQNKGSIFRIFSLNTDELLPTFGLQYRLSSRFSLGGEYFKERNWTLHNNLGKQNIDNVAIKLAYRIY